jgi:hypothetical protein
MDSGVKEKAHEIVMEWGQGGGHDKKGEEKQAGQIIEAAC